MGYDGWAFRPKGLPSYLDFCERGWQRASLAEWDARWQRLSVPARRALLTEVKAPPQGYAAGSVNAGTPVTKFQPEILKELSDAGFLRVVPGELKTRPDRVVTVNDAGGFRTRVRALHRIRLLGSQEPGRLEKYINTACYPSRLVPFVSGVLREAGIDTVLTEEGALTYLTSERWPDLVLKAVKDPVAEKVLNAARKSGEPLPIDDLPKLVKVKDSAQVRAALDRLVTYLALFEDLNDATLAIEVGLLPEVRARIAAAALKVDPPALAVCQSTRELAADTAPLIDDLRAFLLEVASDPPRLRQDGEIFSKETERFYQTMDPLPGWLADHLQVSPESRLDKAYSEASTLKLVKEHREGEKELRLRLTSAGQAWISADAREQYTKIYESFRKLPRQEKSYFDYELGDYRNPYASHWSGYYSPYVLTDRVFLGAEVSVAPPRSGKGEKKSVTPTVNDLEAVREAVGKALLKLPEGVYHTLGSVTEHFVCGDRNVFLLGHGQEDVRVFDHGRPVPPLSEAREAVGRRALKDLVLARLIPLGALRAAVDDEGRLCVARTARLGAYFGFEPVPEPTGVGGSGGAKVVVQPDFSVVVIGLSTAALAELAPFCERSTRGGSGPGASVLKITRDSVTRAIAQGLKPQQILDRLRKHATHEPPANVLREIKDWGGWVKSVSTERLTVVRCPDREAADRVVGVLKRQVERLNDTTLALDTDRLLPSDRKKLRDNGILVSTSAEGPGPTAPKKKTSRRRYY